MAVALGVAGCGLPQEGKAPQAVGAPEASPAIENARPQVQIKSSKAAVDASIKDSLDRLNSLQLFSVDGLVLKLPAQASECYGIPCPGDKVGQAEYDAERARQASRLAKLAALAGRCSNSLCYDRAPESADQAVQALNALQIVQVGSLIAAQPANNPDCYNLPCQSDKDAAAAENQRRATVAFTTAQMAQEEGF
jgi:hypothetical protein